jgi:predicted PhzF superfamily epimerase YddE/YHI9
MVDMMFRIFTPKKEVPLTVIQVGHAYVIQYEIIRKPIETVILSLNVGQISVTINYNGRASGHFTDGADSLTFGRFLIRSKSQRF